MIPYNKKIIIFGIGPFGEICDEYLNNYPDKVIGFAEDEGYSERDEFKGLPIFTLNYLDNPEEYYIYVAVGYGGIIPNDLREDIVNRVKGMGFNLLTFLHKDSIYNNDSFKNSEHNFVFELNNIQPFVTIGNNNIFWSGNHLGHHSIIGNHNFFSSHVVVSGNCKIGNNNFFGVNSTIIDGITIGSGCIVGAGALILKDVPDNSKVIGIWK